MPKITIHCIRHAQGYHNLSLTSHLLPDPSLTPLGTTQCTTLSTTFPYTTHLTHLISSLLRRTLYTTLLSSPSLPLPPPLPPPPVPPPPTTSKSSLCQKSKKRPPYPAIRGSAGCWGFGERRIDRASLRETEESRKRRRGSELPLTREEQLRLRDAAEREWRASGFQSGGAGAGEESRL
ncbi:uncharacterized protein LY89DRAFT_208189 [Mollisia scopiformis]|uniref:Phosphoglycerate mutase family protein n=1 Tax=Mollisia scopiformis TaxID=149040 RepID=A0A194WWW3_MOLSC|nr:uncharacterized protein LY89DRAFT_208189 [Mollisia scopiformis]KUJ12471.1 hypothetical protein LY89DRAFT_208189 [Mollisia scopiformis]